MRNFILSAIRKGDMWGTGWFGDSRVTNSGPAKRYRHRGVDFSAREASGVLAPVAGKVTKIGYPYNPNDPDKGHLRYVQITDAEGRRWRLFYVRPVTVHVGSKVREGDLLGDSQGLGTIYPGIEDHIHLEILKKGGDRRTFESFLNPLHLLKTPPSPGDRGRSEPSA